MNRDDPDLGLTARSKISGLHTTLSLDFDQIAVLCRIRHSACKTRCHIREAYEEEGSPVTMRGYFLLPPISAQNRKVTQEAGK